MGLIQLFEQRVCTKSLSKHLFALRTREVELDRFVRQTRQNGLQRRMLLITLSAQPEPKTITDPVEELTRDFVRSRSIQSFQSDAISNAIRKPSGISNPLGDPLGQSVENSSPQRFQCSFHV